VVGTTWGGTICWNPRKPSSYAIVSGDGDREHVIRCGWCPGCLELDRRRLADRLQSLFSKVTGELWIVEVEAEQRSAVRSMKSLRRTVGMKRSSGMYRLTPNRVACIVAGSKPCIAAATISTGYRVTLRRVRRSRGRRAWGLLTSGMLTPRETWGEDRNRYYHRGLPAAEREKWAVTTRGGIRKRHEQIGNGARAWRGDVSLYPPLAWLPPRLLHRRGPLDKRHAKPTSIAGTLAGLLDRLRVGADRSETIPVNRDARSASLNRPGKLEVMTDAPSGVSAIIPPQIAGGEQTRRVRRTFAKTGSSILDEAGYRSSEHGVGAWAEAWAERMKRKHESQTKRKPDE